MVPPSCATLIAKGVEVSPQVLSMVAVVDVEVLVKRGMVLFHQRAGSVVFEKRALDVPVALTSKCVTFNMVLLEPNLTLVGSDPNGNLAGDVPLLGMVLLRTLFTVEFKAETPNDEFDALDSVLL